MNVFQNFFYLFLFHIYFFFIQYNKLILLLKKKNIKYYFYKNNSVKIPVLKVKPFEKSFPIIKTGSLGFLSLYNGFVTPFKRLINNIFYCFLMFFL